MKHNDKVGGYVLVEFVGRGGMGEVWTARHGLDADARYAIKFLSEDFLRHDELKRRFEQECIRHMNLRHPHIVEAIESIDARPTHPPGLVTRFLAGGSLRKRLGRPLPSDQIVRTSLDILDALEYAHQNDVVHRDVKPENILLDEHDNALLADFGIALLLSEQRATRTGEILGSDQYMSPEQIEHPRTIDRRSDIFSFGCVFYEMLTGVAPFYGSADPIEARLQPRIPSPSKRNPSANRAFDRAAMTCLQKDPDARYQTARELIEDLQKTAPLSVAVAVGANSLPPPAIEPNRGETRRAESETPTVIPPARPVPAAPAAPAAPAPPVEQKMHFGDWLPPNGRRFALILLALAAAMALVWFLFRKPPPGVAPAAPEENVVLRIYGSTSVGDELTPALARAFLRAQLGATETGCYVTNKSYKGHDVPMKHCWGKVPAASQRSAVEVYSVGSEEAFSCLTDKTCDIGMSSRRYSSADSNRHPGLEPLAKPASEHVIGLDGIAIVVNAANPIPKLTLSQVKGIFCNSDSPIDTWDQLGVPQIGTIHRTVRNVGSGTRDMFVSLVCQGATLRDVPAEDQLKSEDLVNRVTSNSSAIGFVSSTLTGRATAVPLAAVAGQPALRPDNFAVVTEDYILTRRLYLYNNSSVSPLADKFIAFAKGKEGQEVAKENRFVSLVAETVGVTPQNATPEFTSLTVNARRLGLSFHFGSAKIDLTLDPLAEDNIERVKNFMDQNAGAELLVFGFADNLTPKISDPSNLELSQRRAASVASALVRQGLPYPTVVKGFGEAMPVDSNATEAGRIRNRRVEIWIRR